MVFVTQGLCRVLEGLIKAFRLKSKSSVVGISSFIHVFGAHYRRVLMFQGHHSVCSKTAQP